MAHGKGVGSAADRFCNVHETYQLTNVILLLFPLLMNMLNEGQISLSILHATISVYSLYIVQGGDVMDLNAISTLVSNIGVPCACLIATFYLWQKETEAHKDEMLKMTDALNNNTLAITKLTEHITGGDKD